MALEKDWRFVGNFCAGCNRSTSWVAGACLSLGENERPLSLQGCNPINPASFGWFLVEHPFEKRRAEISFTGIGQDHHNRFALHFRLFGDAHRRRHRRAAGDSA